jgi:hypothetical protein
MYVFEEQNRLGGTKAASIIEVRSTKHEASNLNKHQIPKCKNSQRSLESGAGGSLKVAASEFLAPDCDLMLDFWCF